MLQKTSTSLYTFAAYMLLLPGVGLVFFPTLLLELFQLAYNEPLWPTRLAGLLAFILGAYYYLIAKHEIKVLYRSTIALRGLAVVFFVALLVLGQVESIILLFAAVDALGAAWTAWTLKK
ncbi:MAG: hypothetical protein ACRBFS_20625 [Aureispira sp.]